MRECADCRRRLLELDTGAPNSACIALATSYSLCRMRAPATVCLVVLFAASALRSTATASAQTNAVAMVSARKSDWRIVSPSATAPGVDWAAKELQHYIRQISGCELPIAKQTGSNTAS